jgi:heme A synthase
MSRTPCQRTALVVLLVFGIPSALMGACTVTVLATERENHMTPLAQLWLGVLGVAMLGLLMKVRELWNRKGDE